MSKTVNIVGVGRTPLGRLGKTATELASWALDLALTDARMDKHHLQGLVAVPSLAQPHFMQAHYYATQMGLMDNEKMLVRTIDTGGAGPVSALTAANHFIRNGWAETVAIIASDAVLSLNNEEFVKRADSSVAGCGLPSPCIPNGYDRVARWQMETYGLTRRQLAMVPVLMSHYAARRPEAMCKKQLSLDEVLNSRQIAPATSLLECARRADGAVCLVLSSSKHYKRTFPNGKHLDECPVLVSTGEASGPLYPPEKITDNMFSCEKAAKIAYSTAQLGVSDIDYFGLYDCFPIALIRALEAVGICDKGAGGAYVEKVYNSLLANGTIDAREFPVNLHGGLQCHGAPWEVPAAYNITDAVLQLTGKGTGEGGQLLPRPRRALVYGNGGIFSASAVAILGDGRYK